MAPKRKTAATNGAGVSTDSGPDYSKMTVAELKIKCTSAGLDNTGKKQELIDRLKASADSVDYAKMTIAKLKSECASKGFDTAGKKQDLIDRLSGIADDDSPSPAKLAKQSTIQRAMEVMKHSVANEMKSKKKRMVGHKVDQYFPYELGEVHEDYDCMLNQTNIRNNNNKYYIIQVVKIGFEFYAFNRWGRVGEPGARATKGPFSSPDDAIKDFEKKFNDKTRNSWSKRDQFKPVHGKYTLLEMGDQDEDSEQATITVTKDGKPMGKLTTRPSQLDAATQAFVKLIFDNDMFKNALIKMDIDIKKMPLGKLSKAQILKGFEILDEMKQALDVKNPSAAKLTKLSNDFYTAIPHDFGRRRPQIINDHDLMRKKLDMLITLSDIELAQEMLKKKPTADDSKKLKDTDLPPHPLDENYDLLRCKLKPLSKNEEEYKIIDKYIAATGRNCYNNMKLLDAWRMDRETEDDRFKAHSSIGHRKLLWHGTNVAVVAAILKSGLRIMPHSGGRVGKGIYLASENSKSAGYVGTTNDGIGIMFLVEAALGKEHTLLHDNSGLNAAPPGCDSIVARGYTEPDPKFDTTLNLDGKKVVVPQGKPINTPFSGKSSFSQSEYLVYKESQVRLRYVLKLKMY